MSVTQSSSPVPSSAPASAPDIAPASDATPAPAPASAPQSPASFERRIDARLILAVVACGIMSFAGVVVETAMNVTFPSLMAEFSVDTASVQWITTGYLLVLACIVPLSSFLKRRFRTKQLFVAAIALFASGTVMCAAAPSFWVLVAGRVVQGFGTGMALPLMFNIVIEQTPISRMGLMMGVATLITATAPAVGPSVGGFIVETWGWRAIFLVLLPFLAVSFACGMWAIRQVSATERARFGAGQFALLAGSFACLVFATSAASTAGWLSGEVLGLLAGFVVLLAAFCAVALRSREPLIDVRAFRCVPFSLSTLYVVLFQAIVLGLGYLIPYYAQTVLGAGEMQAGCLLLPGCIVGAVLAPLGGRILDALGAARPLVFGAFAQLAAMACFWAFGFGEEAWVLAAVYVLIPIGQGFSMANTMTNGLSYLPESLKPDGNAVFNTFQQLGGAVGMAVASSIVNAAQTLQPADLAAGTALGAHEACAVLLAVSLVALACTLGALACAQKRPGRGGSPRRAS